MAYRDESEMLRARVLELEGELREVRAENAKLRRLGDGERTLAARVLGAPLALVEERLLDGALDDASREAIIDTLRQRFGVLGRTRFARASGSVTWECRGRDSQRVLEVVMRSEQTEQGPRTRVRMVERLGATAGGLFGGIVGGVGGGLGLGIGIPAALAISPALLALLPLPAVLSFVAVRLGFAALVRRRARELREVIDALPSPSAALPSAAFSSGSQPSVTVPNTRVDESVAAASGDASDATPSAAPATRARAR